MTESQRLQRMLVSTIDLRDAEYHRVSRLLHDEVGQVLSAVGLQLDVMRLDFETNLPEIAPRTREIQQMLDEAVQRVRSLSYELNPSVVERAGLRLALEHLTARLQKNFAGALQLSYTPSSRIPPAVANAWYKIAELAVENAIRHASASNIKVQVKLTPSSVVLEVRDNGSGFEVDLQRAQSKGLGLLLLEHYKSQAPIGLQIRSSQGKGTVVRSVYTAAS